MAAYTDRAHPHCFKCGRFVSIKKPRIEVYYSSYSTTYPVHKPICNNCERIYYGTRKPLGQS